MSDKLQTFGDEVWSKLTAQPLGSLTKREMELTLLRAAIQAGLLEARADKVASVCSIPLAKAHGYLTDLALRQSQLNDQEAISRLVKLLGGAEVVLNEPYVAIPLYDAALRIWLERKMATLYLNAGDTLRRDHVKLTTAGLAKLIGASEGIVSPIEALHALPKELRSAEWVKKAGSSWKKGMSWVDAMSVLGNTAAIAQTVIPALMRSFSA